MTLNLYYNTKSEGSKCNWVMNSLLAGWPDSQPVSKRAYTGEPAAFWGFIQNNWPIIEQHEKNNTEWWFWDMPFWGRWSKNSSQEHYWHAAKNNIYPTVVKPVPADRFSKWQCNVIEYKRSGKHILICPSSDTMTQWITGKTRDEWTSDTILELKKYTDRPIHVRYKPRVRGISGPDAEPLTGHYSVQQELEDCWCVITTVSLVAVEAQLQGVPTFCDPRSFAASVSQTDLSRIENPIYADRHPWLYWLAYNQFTEAEIKSGLAYDTLTNLYKD